MREAVVLLGLLAVPTVSAGETQMPRVESREAFLALVKDKVLSRPLVRLRVSEEGDITGRGAGSSVVGRWEWRDGFFCRDLAWGGEELGYNCQEVRATETVMRFTSDEGTGDHADFRLR